MQTQLHYNCRTQVDPKLTEQCVKNLVFIGRAMHLNPDLCFTEEGAEDNEQDEDEDQREIDHEENNEQKERSSESEDQSTGCSKDSKDTSELDSSSGAGAVDDSINNDSNAKDPLRWVFNRMSHMVVHKGEARRRAVFSWFAAMSAVHEPAVAQAHLRLMLLPLRRAVLDAEAGGVKPTAGESAGGGSGGRAKEQTSAELATEVCVGIC